MHNNGCGGVSSSRASTAPEMVLQCLGWWHSGRDGRTGLEEMEETRSTGLMSWHCPAQAQGKRLYLFRGFHRPLSRGATWRLYGSGRHIVTKLTPAFPHSSHTVLRMAAHGGLVEQCRDMILR
jgi:hypothetical protein